MTTAASKTNGGAMAMRIGLGLFLLAVVIFVAHANFYRPWVKDDPYITFQYARNLVDGNGLVFNPGEKVEGFSNPSWVLLAALAFKLGVDPLWMAHLAGILAGLVALFFSWRVVADLLGESSWTAALAPLLLAITPMLPRHSVTGMETSLFVAGLLAAVHGLGGREHRGATGVALVGLFLLITTRPEGFAFALLLVAWRLYQNGWQDGPGRLALLVTATALASLFAGRLLYYGEWLPNTVHAKVTGSLRGYFEGVLYSIDFLRDSGGGVLLGCFLAVALWRDTWRLFSLLILCVGLMAAVVVSAGGDWMHLYRFYVPVYPLLITGAVAGGVRLRGAVAASTGRSRLVTGVFAVAAGAAFLNVYKEEKEVIRYVMPSVHDGTYLADVYRDVGLWLNENTPPDAEVAVCDIGLVGFYGQRVVVDMFGLIDPHIARVEGRQHFKSDPQHVLDRKPECIILVQAVDGHYWRVPDIQMNETAAFHADYHLVKSFPVGFLEDRVDVYRRKD